MLHEILLVEDDATLREWMSYELEGEGYRVTLAADGPSGLNCAQHQPDLILLDVQMPGMSGFAVGQSLQSSPQTAGIPIIYLTALNSTQNKIKGLKCGGVNYITKPFKMGELKANIASVLHHTSVVRQNSVSAIEAVLAQAAEVQRQLIPRSLPDIPTLEMHADYQAAAQVGGDFYDFFERPDGQLVFTIADVSGKGLPAAMMMSSIRTALRHAAAQLASPKLVLEQVNAQLYQDLTDVRKLVTIFMGFYDPKSRALTYANMGHTPVIFCPLDKSARILAPDGPPLGVFPNMASFNHTLRLEPDDLLVLCSDGFSEAESLQGEMFGYDRLLSLVNRFALRPTYEISRRLFEAMADFTKNRRQDDQTLAILRGI